jgi:hypothetical protein
LFSWVRLGIATASLTACNHSGDLALGRLNLQLIDNLIPNIAGRWEYASDLMHSIVVQAVHLIDGFEHEVACDKLRLVVGYYQGLGELFDSAYPGLFPELVRSKFCGDALGTMVQAQIGLILQGKTTVDEARLTSKMAVEQFSDEADRKRQFQCRSEIDCIAGEWDAARKNLMLAIGAARADHDSLSKCIAELDAESRAFPLLHWTRIGGMAAIADAKDELVSFLAAWNVSGLDSYIQKELSTYPAHGILRRVAGVYAACGRYTKMVESIRTLRQVVLVNPTPLLRLIETASVLQAAGLAGRTDPQQMMNLICGTRHYEPIEKSLQKIISETVVNQPRIAEIAKHFLSVVNEDLSSEQLIYAAQIVGY